MSRPRRSLKLTDRDLERCEQLGRRLGRSASDVARQAFELGLGEAERSEGISVVGGVLGAVADGLEAVDKLRAAWSIFSGAPEPQAPASLPRTTEAATGIVVRRRRAW